MNRTITKIQLFKSDTDTQGNTVEGYLDIKESAEFPINISISDIRNAGSRSGAFSKTIQLTGSKNNNQLLNNYFEVNVKSGKFDLNKKQKCAVIQNGVVILDNCYLRIIRAEKVQDRFHQIDDLVEYDVEIRDTLGDFFNEINNKELTDLNFSEFNHNYLASNVISSFTHSYVDGYKYILPWIDNNTFNLKECLPGIYAKQYFDKIHSDAGYEYEWNDLTDVRFDDMIIPFNGDIKKITEDELELVTTIVGNTSSQSATNSYFPVSNGASLATPWNGYTIDMNYSTLNYLSTFDLSTDRWVSPFTITAPSYVSYEVRINWDFIIQNNESENIRVKSGPGTLFFDRRLDLGVININNGAQPLSIKPLQANTLATGTTIIGDLIRRNTGSPSLPPGQNIIASGENTLVLSISNLIVGNTFELQSCIRRNIGIFSLVSNNNTNADFEEIIRINSIEVTIKPSLDSFGYNFPVEMNKFIPTKVKQGEFLKSVYKMFNLFMEVDKVDSNKLIYKSRDDFYDSGVIKDWTYKMDKNKQELFFIPELSSKRHILSYKQDSSDFYLEQYLKNTNEVYGQIEVIFDNENVKGTVKDELIFSPTVNQWTNYGAVKPIWNASAPKNNIRILLDNGIETCGAYSIENFSGNSQTITTYPFISMLDSIENPQYDIAFGINDYYSYDIKNYTSNNLYTHWRRTMSQINSGKLLVAYFWLNEEDIFKLKLNDKIKINNALWYINKIIDYKVNKKQLTKVELLSVEDDLVLPRFGRVVNFISSDQRLPDISPALPVGPFLPNQEVFKEITKERNKYTSFITTTKDYINLGTKNELIDDFSGVVVGDGVKAAQSGFYVDDTSLVSGELKIGDAVSLGGAGLVVNGTEIKDNGLYLNSRYFLDDYIDWDYYVAGNTASISFSFDQNTEETTTNITGDNILINGQPFGLSKIDIVTANTFSVASYDLDVFLVGTGSVVNINLPEALTDGVKYTFKDFSGVSNTNNININAFSGDTIDGSSSYTMNVNYQSITIVSYSGTGWYII
jgi:hypothetical protein